MCDNMVTVCAVRQVLQVNIKGHCHEDFVVNSVLKSFP